MPSSRRREAERIKAHVDSLYPPPPSLEEARRRTEAFLETWVADVVHAAHAARDARLRGESLQRATDQMSGVQIMGACVSYGGEVPPHGLRTALRRLTHDRGGDGLIPEALVEKYNLISREVLRRSLGRFADEAS